MKIKTAFTVLASLPAVFAFAQTINEETTWTDENVPALSSTSQIYVNNTLNWQVSASKVNELNAIRTTGDKGLFNMSYGSLNLGYLWLANTDAASKADAKLSNGASITVANFAMAGISDSTASFEISDNAILTATNTSNIGNGNGGIATINVSDSATLKFAAQLNLGSGQNQGSGGKGTINLTGGNAKLIMGGGMNFLGAYASRGELNVSGGTVSSDGLNGKIARLTVGFTSDGAVNLSGGATYVNQMDLGSWIIGNNVSSSLNVSGADTVLDVSTLNVGLDNRGDLLAEVVLSNLSTVKIGNASFADTGRFKINVGASSKNSVSASIQISGNLNYGGDPLAEGFVFDFADMDNQILGLADGDTLVVNLFSVGGTFSIYDSAFDKSNGAISDFLDGNAVLKNNTDMRYWEDVDYGNFAWDKDTNTLSVLMTYKGSTIPEPSTTAVIFGAFALAFAAYCRRK